MRNQRAVALVLAIAATAAVVSAVVYFRRASAVHPAEARAEPTSRIVAAGDEAAIVLGGEAAARADLATAPLRASGSGVGASDAGAIPAAGLAGELVTDPARGATIRAALPGRLSSSAWPALDSRVVQGQLLGRVSDAAPMLAPRGGTVIRVGAQPGEVVQAGQELLALADLRALLARIVWRPELGRSPPPVLEIAPLEGGLAGSGRTRARLIGGTAGVDSLTRLPVYLYRLDGTWPGARPGAPVMATAPATASGAAGGRADASRGDEGDVLVPNAAVVQWEGLAWAFVERRPGSFVRARVMTDRPVPAGYIVTTASSGLHPGDLVVTRGAQQLLSEEFRTHVRMSDDADAQ